jgi:hypothetical protein
MTGENIEDLTLSGPVPQRRFSDDLGRFIIDHNFLIAPVTEIDGFILKGISRTDLITCHQADQPTARDSRPQVQSDLYLGNTAPAQFLVGDIQIGRQPLQGMDKGFGGQIEQRGSSAVPFTEAIYNIKPSGPPYVDQPEWVRRDTGEAFQSVNTNILEHFHDFAVLEISRKLFQHYR